MFGSVLRMPTYVAFIPVAVMLGFGYYLYWGHAGAAAEGAAKPFSPFIVSPVDDIRNSTLGFEKLFAINLPSRTDRRQALTESATDSGLTIDFIDGVFGEDVVDATLTPEQNRKLNNNLKGSWRAHINVLRKIVNENIATAVIFEDDVDWDVRIRTQLESFAVAAQTLLSPAYSPVLANSEDEVPNVEINETYSYLARARDRIQSRIHSIPMPPTVQQQRPHHNPATDPPRPGSPRHRNSIPDDTPSSPLFFQRPALHSPYGDPTTWDLLWLGHCGAGFPMPSKEPNTNPNAHVRLRRLLDTVLASRHDMSVPAPHHLRWAPPPGPADPLASMFPPHTRVYHRIGGGALCTTAYAVTQRGAQRILRRVGGRVAPMGFDSQLGVWCGEGVVDADWSGAGAGARIMGAGVKEEEAERLVERICLTVQPPLFGMHKRAEADTGELLADGPQKAETKYVRWSVRRNHEKLLEGDTQYEDQWPD